VISERGSVWRQRRVLPIAHRGGSAEGPENTLAALRRGARLGCPMVEFDVRATADGEIVVLHDPTVDRTTDGSGSVSDLTLEEVRSLDAAYWFTAGSGTDDDHAGDDHPLRGVASGDRPPSGDVDPEELRIPTLREVLAALPGTWMTIEIKATAPDATPYEEAVVSLLREFGRERDVILASFHEEALAAVREHAPEVCTSTPPPEILALWQAAHDETTEAPPLDRCALQAPALWGGIDVVSPALVDLAHSRGLAVHVWTVDDPAEMRRMVDAGVDGILSDHPSRLVGVLDELGVRWGSGEPG
jgi:glycerophosphoryl diester phosphodiesterase